MTTVRHSSLMPVTAEALFAFHMDPANLAAISPAFPPVRVEAPDRPPVPGDLQTFVLGWNRCSSRCVARVERVIPGRLLEDTQESGPFIRWRHQHRVAEVPGGARLTDVVSFRLFPSLAGEFFEFWTVRPLLKAMFWYRHRKTRRLVLRHDGEARGRSALLVRHRAKESPEGAPNPAA